MAKSGPKTQEGKAKAMANLQKGMWRKGESGNPGGRPRRMIKRLADKIGTDFNMSLTKEDLFEIIGSMIELSVNELKLIALDNDAPSFMVMVASAIKADIALGKLSTVETIFNRLYGKPEQRAEVVTRNKPMTEEEIEEELSELQGILKNL